MRHKLKGGNDLEIGRFFSTINIFDMNTESTKTREKKIETLEEATSAVLNQNNTVYDEINLAMMKVAESRHALYEAKEALKDVVEKYGEDNRIYVDKINAIIGKMVDIMNSDGGNPSSFEGLIRSIRNCCKSGPINYFDGRVTPPSEQ